MMTDAQMISMLQTPPRWPARVLLPLTHRSRRDDFGTIQCGVLAMGHGARVYLANIADFSRADLVSQKSFDAALKRFSMTAYLSYAAIISDGWRID